MTAAPHPVSRIHVVLDEIAGNVDGVRALVVGDPNGLPIASVGNRSNTMAATAVATLVLSAARNVAINLQLSEMEDVLIEGQGWKVLVQSLGAGFTLIFVLSDEVNLGFVKLLTAKHVPELQELIERLM